MDFKGITWAGNIYQKFETMCMEVEEVMYQDTVKYMENQVQKVGGSVKKFYSEVMQDLLPMSSVKVAAADSQDLSSITNANAATEEKENQDESIFDVKAEKEPLKKLPSYSIRSLSKTSHGAVVQDKRPELFSVRTKKAGAHKTLGIKRISRNNHALETANSSAVKTKSEDAVTLSSDSAVKEKMPTSEIPQENPSSDKDLSAESLKEKKGDDPKNMPVASENNASAISAVREIERASEPASSCIFPTASKVAHTSLSDISLLKSGAFVEIDALNVESENYFALTSNEDKLESELIENEQVTAPREEISDPTETSKLEASCVFIEGNTLIQHIPEGTVKHKSYKQKIRTAFLSKLRSTKKQHQLVSEYKDLGGKKPILDIMSSEKRTLSADADALESDWEIL